MSSVSIMQKLFSWLMNKKKINATSILYMISYSFYFLLCFYLRVFSTTRIKKIGSHSYHWITGKFPSIYKFGHLTALNVTVLYMYSNLNLSLNSFKIRPLAW